MWGIVEITQRTKMYALHARSPEFNSQLCIPRLQAMLVIFLEFPSFIGPQEHRITGLQTLNYLIHMVKYSWECLQIPKHCLGSPLQKVILDINKYYINVFIISNT